MKKLYGILSAYVGMLFLSVGSVMAQDVTIDTSASQVTSNIGTQVTGFGTLVIFIQNLFIYLGWVGVIIGVLLALFALIYKLMNSDSEDAMKTVQGYITKAVLIVVIGILLISSGFIIRVVAQFFGFSINDAVGTTTSATATT